MSTPPGDTLETRPLDAGAGEWLRRVQIFLGWCLRTEVRRVWNWIAIVAPVIVVRYLTGDSIGRNPLTAGRHLLSELFWGAALLIMAGGARHASTAVCWEVANEQRDLVRLTGIPPRTLLWCTSLARWWTVGLSIAVMLPLALFARTMGAISWDQWFAGGCWLLMVAALTAGFAMISSVSSNQATNPETTAAMATFLLLILYNLAFLAVAAFLGIAYWLGGGYSIPTKSLWSELIQFVLGLAPTAGLYSAFALPASFNPLMPSYWIHGLTAAFCCWSASVVINNRFRVTSQGDAPSLNSRREHQLQSRPVQLHPRCSERPFFWKDKYILGGGNAAQLRWLVVSLFSLAGVVMANLYNFSLVAGVMSVCVLPCLIAIRFDALLAPEFREQTWNGLMLLPVEPEFILFEKARAAVSERKSLLLPVALAGACAVYWSPVVWFMTAVIALMAGLLMIEISILNQFFSKNVLITTGIAIAMIAAIVLMVPPWAFFNRWLSFTITLAVLSVVSLLLGWMIRWRLRNWTDS